MSGEIKYNVWMSLGKRPETRWQFLRPGEEADALPGARIVGHMVTAPVPGFLVWVPEPKWQDLPHIDEIVQRQFKGFLKFIGFTKEGQ